MVVQDKIRSSLYTQLEQSFGTEEAGLLMEAVPPLGWSSLVTHDHLDARVAQIDARFDRVDARFAAFEAQVDARFEKVDARFDRVDARLDTMVTTTEFQERIHLLHEDLSRQQVTKHQFSAGLAELRADFHRDQFRLLLALMALLISLTGVLVAAAHVHG